MIKEGREGEGWGKGWRKEKKDIWMEGKVVMGKMLL